MRGIYFLLLNQNKLNVKRVVEFDQPMSSATGYGFSPLTVIENKEDRTQLR
jgi:hypothetical protein